MTKPRFWRVYTNFTPALHLMFIRRMVLICAPLERISLSMKKPGWIVFCFAVLSGCAQAPVQAPPQAKDAPKTQTSAKSPAPVKQQALAEPGSIGALMKFAQAYAALTPELQRREYAQISARRKTEYSRMQLATMAMMTRPRDDGRVLTLLDDYLKAPESRDEDLRGLAGLLKAAVSGQNKSDETAQLTQKLKDEQKRADMLQRKLDELLAVEKAMSDRREAQPK